MTNTPRSAGKADPANSLPDADGPSLAPAMPSSVPAGQSVDPAEQTLGEEIANALTHGLSAIAAIVGLVWLVVLASSGGDPWRIVTLSIFGACLVILYAASTLYHALRPGRAKQAFRVIDHAAIYLLIAGSYTPFMLVSIRGPWGWSLFGVVWGLAIFGTIYKIICIDKWPAVSVTVYVVMGWLAIIAIKPLLAMLPGGGLAWLVAGGLAYSLGIIFYVWEKLPFNHAIWHGFVSAGSICHFLAVLWYVLPVAV